MKYEKRGKIIRKTDLRNDFIINGLRKRELAKKNNTTVHIIKKSLDKHNLVKLRERYIRFLFSIGLRQYEIAPKINRDQAAVSRLLKSIGVDCSLVRSDRTTETMLSRYGVSNCQKIPSVRQKTIDTCLTRYGYDTPLRIHNCHITGKWYDLAEDIFRNKDKSSFSTKIYTYPSGRTIYTQGYEHLCLDILLNKYNENEISTDRDHTVPIIRFTDIDGIRRLHFPDIFIKSENRIIEVKSSYTLEKSKYIMDKYYAAEQQGYNYELWVFSSNKPSSLEIL